MPTHCRGPCPSTGLILSLPIKVGGEITSLPVLLSYLSFRGIAGSGRVNA
jgi:hypothetical protein